MGQSGFLIKTDGGILVIGLYLSEHLTRKYEGTSAVDLAALVRPRYLVPHHYDMFTFNTVAVEVFEAEARRLPAGVEPRILHCGERWEIKQ